MQQQPFHTVLVSLFSGYGLGAPQKELRDHLGIRVALRIDISEDALSWNNTVPITKWEQKHSRGIRRAIRKHDFIKEGPFNLQASLEPGMYIPGKTVLDCGVLKGRHLSKKNDLGKILNAVRRNLKKRGRSDVQILVLSSPPCVMFSAANSMCCKDEVADYIRVTKRHLRRVANLVTKGRADILVCECQAQKIEIKNELVSAMPGYEAKYVHAETYSSFSKRRRIFFAKKRTMNHLPSPTRFCGWGVGLRYSGKTVTLHQGCWSPKNGERSVFHANCTSPTLTTMPIYQMSSGYEHALSVTDRAKLLGILPSDPNMKKLTQLSAKQGCIATGQTFAVNWLLAVLYAALQTSGRVLEKSFNTIIEDRLAQFDTEPIQRGKRARDIHSMDAIFDKENKRMKKKRRKERKRRRKEKKRRRKKRKSEMEWKNFDCIK